MSSKIKDHIFNKGIFTTPLNTIITYITKN